MLRRLLLACPAVVCACAVQPDVRPVAFVRDSQASYAPSAGGAAIAFPDGALRVELVGLTAGRPYMLSLNCLLDRPAECDALKRLGGEHNGQGYWDFHQFQADGAGRFAATVRPDSLAPMAYRVKLLVKDPTSPTALLYANDVDFVLTSPSGQRALTDWVSRPVAAWAVGLVALIALFPAWLAWRSRTRLQKEFHAHSDSAAAERDELKAGKEELSRELAAVQPSGGELRTFTKRDGKTFLLRKGVECRLDHKADELLKLISDAQAELAVQKQGYWNDETARKAIQRSLEEIEQQDRDLGVFLRARVKTGAHCYYGRPVEFRIVIFG